MTEMTHDPLAGLPTPEGRPAPLKTSLSMAGYLLWNPRKAFIQMRETPSWVPMFVLLSLLSILLGWLIMPYNVRAGLTALPVDAPEALKATSVANFERMQRTGLMLVPLLMVAKLLFCGAFLWLMAIYAQGRVAFRKAMALSAHVGLLALLEAWAGFASVAWRGMGAIHSPFALQPRIGLNALISTASVPLNAFLGGINPFAVWYVAVLATGLALLFDLPRKWAVGIATAYWGFVLVFQVGIAAIAALLSRIH